MTQNEMVLHFIKEHDGITSMDAFNYLNITRLSARIHDLRQLGHIIDTENVTAKNVYGHSTTFARYYLVKEAEDGGTQDVCQVDSAE